MTTRLNILFLLAALALMSNSSNADQVLVNFGDTAYTSDGVNTW